MLVLACFSLAGCQSVCVTRPDAVPLAMWGGPLIRDANGVLQQPKEDDCVLQVLRAHRLHPMASDSGFVLPDSEEMEAREVLLTDHWLAGSNVLIYLMVPAGTGRETPHDFKIPALMPPEPLHVAPMTEPAATQPTTQPITQPATPHTTQPTTKDWTKPTTPEPASLSTN